MAAFEVPWAELQKVQEGDAMQTDVGAHGCCGLRGGAPRSKRKMQQDAACHTAREAKAKGASLTDSDSDDDSDSSDSDNTEAREVRQAFAQGSGGALLLLQPHPRTTAVSHGTAIFAF